MLRKYLPYALISVGILIIVFALYQKISTMYYQNKLVEEYESYINQLNLAVNEDEETDKQTAGAEFYDEASNKIEDTVEIEEIQENPADKYLEGKNISGIIEIPKLGVKAAILEGTDDRALKYTVGHYPGTANPGEKGNFVLLGHRNYVYGHFFRRINELEAGDEVVISKDTSAYTYYVTESFVVSPEEVWVLDQTDDSVLTMITCTPMVTYTHRLIVRGILLEQ